MTEAQALRDLLAKVELGNMMPVDLIFMEAMQHSHAWKAYNGSLDAAMGLHEAVLPGWEWVRLFTGTMWVEPRDNPGAKLRCFRPDNPARAWLIAILKAMIAQAEQ